MGDRSAIEWTEATWNPVVGCSKVSPGCAHCYAEELHRTRLDGKGIYPSFRPWTPANAQHNVTLAPERLSQPLRWRRPRMVFVNSMSDLFHELVPVDFIWSVFGVMANAPQHTFQILTKRPERMREVLAEWSPRPNIWLGTSIENRRFVGRADDLRATPASVRFISAEPLLGSLVCQRCQGFGWYMAVDRSGVECTACDGGPGSRPSLDLGGIDWLIVGGESGPKRRPVNPDWVRALRDLAGGRGTGFFFKQWGGRTPKAGGRELDGRTWDEMPEPMAIAA